MGQTGRASILSDRKLRASAHRERLRWDYSQQFDSDVVRDIPWHALRKVRIASGVGMCARVLLEAVQSVNRQRETQLFKATKPSIAVETSRCGCGVWGW